MFKGMMTGLFIVIVLLISAVIMIIVSYNGLVKLKNSVEEAFSTMDVYMKKRFDLVPNLAEVVKGYGIHEKEILENLTRARSMVSGASSLNEKIVSENNLDKAVMHTFAVAENYPELRSSENFLSLQKQLEKIEEDIANSRKYYNGVVREFNTKCDSFPAGIIAGIFGFSRYEMYHIDEHEKESVDAGRFL